MPWNKIDRKLSHQPCTQHLQLKQAVSVSQIPATTSDVREGGGQDRLESAAVMMEDITALKSQTQKDKWDLYVCKTLGSAWKLLCAPERFWFGFELGFSLLRIKLSIVTELRDCVTYTVPGN